MDLFPETAARIPLQEIDWEDRSFEIRRLAPVAGLGESLIRCGLLTPLWLLRAADGPLIIVDGFKRLEWLRESGAEAAACIVIPARSRLEEIWLHRLTLKVFGPPLNTAEKARAAACILDFISNDADRKRLLGPLGIPARADILARWRALSAASPSLLCAAATGDLCERAALELASWQDDVEARDALVELFGQLKCSASIQLEIIERISEIGLALETSKRAVLRLPEVSTVSMHPEWNRREKTQALRDSLSRLRYPRLHARERSFHESLAALPLPKTMRISPPAFFEGGVYRLQIDFSSPEALKAHSDAVRALASDPRLELLMHPADPEND